MPDPYLHGGKAAKSGPGWMGFLPYLVFVKAITHPSFFKVPAAPFALGGQVVFTSRRTSHLASSSTGDTLKARVVTITQSTKGRA